MTASRSLRAPGAVALRSWGFALALFSVVAPALPVGPLFAQPPMPLAALWAAYGWAADDEPGWRSLFAPLTLALLGLLHDLLAGGPFGLFMALYVFAYVVGRGAALLMSAPNLLSHWGGFAATALASVLLASVLAPWALGQNVSVRGYTVAAAITALLFPLVRPLYLAPGARR